MDVCFNKLSSSVDYNISVYYPIQGKQIFRKARIYVDCFLLLVNAVWCQNNFQNINKLYNSEGSIPVYVSYTEFRKTPHTGFE